MREESQTKTMRPDLFAHLLFTAPFGVFAIFLAICADLIASFLMTLIAIALFCILRSMAVFVMPEGIRVKKLFYEKSLNWQDIGKVETKVIFTGNKASYMTTLFSSNPSKTDIKINIKFLSKKNVIGLAQILIAKCACAHIDDQTKKMAEGHMPSVFRSVAGP